MGFPGAVCVANARGVAGWCAPFRSCGANALICFVFLWCGVSFILMNYSVFNVFF